ncbi:MAG: 30S ribosome-binding factor RbfA [Acidobacteria bacterium]|nr:MAG: 30S ribosome-binding factor RbfA [Acidobacteriota bacterium]
MAQGNRPDRVAEEIRHVLSETLAREVKDPGIGFLTITAVKISPDLQVARVSYTTLGPTATPEETAKQRAATKAALERVKPFLRRQIGQKMRLRRVPELSFHFDEGIAHQARVEEILIEIQKEREANPIKDDEPK